MPEAHAIVNAYTTGGRLKLLRRHEKGVLVADYIKPEFSAFVKKEDKGKIRDLLAKRPHKDEGEYIRILFTDYDERDRLCRGYWKEGRKILGYFEEKNIKTYEADINPVKRYLIDSKCKIQKPKSGYLDLETDSRVPFATKEEARLLCWGLCIRNEDGTEERFGGLLQEDTDHAERELIKDLFFELKRIDQVLAWNGDRFDFDYLKKRIAILGLDIDFRRWLWCDHMLLFSKYNMTASESGEEKASMALTRVAASLKVPGKLTEKGVGELAGVQVGGARTWQFWKSGGRNRELLLEYCVEDACTMARIEDKSGTVSILASLAETCGVLPDSYGMMGMNFVESFLMRLGAERGMRAPTKYKKKQNDDREQFDGAYVFETKKGLFENVHICDFSRMYPSIMQAWNMSPDTYAGQVSAQSLEEACSKVSEDVAVCPITMESFYKGKRGLFAAALDQIVEQRKYWAKKKLEYPIDSVEYSECDRRDQAYKIIANTFYGVSGSQGSRYYMREVSESVTQIGVWLIQSTATHGNKWKVPLDVLFGDTDSCAFKGCTEDEFSEFVADCNTKLYPSMVTPTGAIPSYISLAFEKSFALMINVEKKTYSGRLSHFKGNRATDDKAPTIKGLEYKRGDRAKLTRDLQEEVVRLILMIGKPKPEAGEYPLTPKDLVPIVETWQRRILTADFDFGEAVVAKKIQKPLKEYGGTTSTGEAIPVPQHVKIAQLLEARGEPIYPGVKIEYVVTDGSTTPQKIKPAADCKKEELDLFYLWEQVVWPAAARVLEAVWPSYPWSNYASVRPKRGVLPGQTGFGFGERGAPLVIGAGIK